MASAFVLNVNPPPPPSRVRAPPRAVSRTMSTLTLDKSTTMPPPPPPSLRVGTTTTRSTRRVVCRAAPGEELRNNNDDDDDDDDGKNHTVLVCGSKTCRRQGALNTLQFFREVLSDDAEVKRVGCLGRCGSGPNVMLLPSELFVGHVNTAAHVARLVERQVRGGEGAETVVQTLALKLEGNVLMEMGDAVGAEAAYSAAIALRPARGAQVLHSNRCAARLAQGGGRATDALDDALITKRMAPTWFRTYARACDAFLALGRKDDALEAMETALTLQPSLMGDAVFMSKFKDLRSSKRERSNPSEAEAEAEAKEALNGKQLF